ncbi:MAG: signal recognition particle protein, partial [Oscillospiraceae bacterium]|nr:signal recognition particle protein [Oscillospiraceae bacterium]
QNGYDTILLDTAGRLHIDEQLMNELKNIKEKARPHEIMLVVDAMTGQDAVSAATAFDNALSIDGVLLTKLDGDARGGAALSIRAATGKPIKFIGTGEKLDMIELFHPERMASRILGMGDMLSLIERAEQSFDEKKAAELERKLRKNRFTLSDYMEQMNQLRKLGDLNQIAAMMPGEMGRQLSNTHLDDHLLVQQEAIILSMTPKERETPGLLDASRKRRIAAGCGMQVSDVNRLLKQYELMLQLTRSLSKGRTPLGLGRMPNVNKVGGLSKMHGFGRKKRLK